jgi:hypothetical protein
MPQIFVATSTGWRRISIVLGTASTQSIGISVRPGFGGGGTAADKWLWRNCSSLMAGGKHENPADAMGCYPTRGFSTQIPARQRHPHAAGKSVGVHASACEYGNNPAVAGLNSNRPGLRFQTETKGFPGGGQEYPSRARTLRRVRVIMNITGTRGATLAGGRGAIFCGIQPRPGSPFS